MKSIFLKYEQDSQEKDQLHFNSWPQFNDIPVQDK